MSVFSVRGGGAGVGTTISSGREPPLKTLGVKVEAGEGASVQLGRGSKPSSHAAPTPDRGGGGG